MQLNNYIYSWDYFRGYHTSLSFFWSMTCVSFGGYGVGTTLGVGGILGSRLLRFQNPAFGPFITNARAHRDRPLKESGLWIAAVRRVDIERTKAILQSTIQDRSTRSKNVNFVEPFSKSALPTLTTDHPTRKTGSKCTREHIQCHFASPPSILYPNTRTAGQRSGKDATIRPIPKVVRHKR